MIILHRLLMVCCAAGFSYAATAGDAHIGEEVNELPIFDAHIHYKESAWNDYSPDDILGMMDSSGVAMGLVSSTPDEGTIMLWEYAPDRIVPEARPYHEDAGPSNWTQSPGMFDYLMESLNAYPHAGVGEFHLQAVDPADEILLKSIARVAIERDLYIHVHSGAEPVEYLFSLEPELKIIWAHAGMSESAKMVESMMETHRTLYADTSYREGDILPSNGNIDPDWRRVLERYSDRFMVGSDTWDNGQWDEYERLIDLNRLWLRHFPRAVAERIAFKNAERLFGRKVHRELIGTR